MSKKRKIFKQKIREMLQEAEKGIVSQIPKAGSEKPLIFQEPSKELEKKNEPKLQKGTTSYGFSIAPIEIIKKDIKTIAIIFLAITIIIVGVAIISQRTNLISTFADKLYNFAQLGN